MTVTHEAKENMSLRGIHHITVMAGDPQRNVDFYTGLLGLRLVKQTVNFDAPDVYHLYYGDESGTPGTLITFFPFPNAARGKRGVGEAGAIAFSIPGGSVEYWIDRLAANAIHFDGPEERFSDEVLSFEDPDGMVIELIPDDTADTIPVWNGSPVDHLHAIRKLYGATLVEHDLNPTAAFLSETLGFDVGPSSANRHRCTLGTDLNTTTIDIVVLPELPPARQSAGSVHHLALRVADASGLGIWREKIAGSGLSVTPVIDRQYFQSIYFREAGGVLFEIATEVPGFTIDEPVGELGTHLMLPKWFEPRRKRIEEILPPLRLQGRI